jgi:hypothetical protein
MKTLKKVLAGLAAPLVLAGTVLAAPSIATAAEGDITYPLFESTPTGTVADRSWTAPSVQHSDTVMGPDEWGRSALGVPEVQPLTQTVAAPPFGHRADLRPNPRQLGVYNAGQYSVSDTAHVFGYPVASNRSAWGTGGTHAQNPGAEYKHRLLAPESSVTLDLAAQFPELGFDGFYVPGANANTGWASSTAKDCGYIATFDAGNNAGMPAWSCANMSASEFGGAGNTNSNPFRARGTATGVELDLTPGQYQRGGGYYLTVVGLAADGTQVPVEVTVAVAAFGGAPSAGSLTYSTPVGVPITIPEADLDAAIGWRTGAEKRLVVDSLPATVTPVAGGYRFLSEAPTVDSFGFRGEERQKPAGIVESPNGTVTITALAVEEPEVITPPTVRDYAFAEPLASGVPVNVDVVALTDGAGFDSTQWELQAADASPWSYRDGILTLTPERDGVFESSFRWVSLVDSSVTSNWGRITAPAAAIEPPVTPEVPAEPEVPAAPETPEAETPAQPNTPAGEQPAATDPVQPAGSEGLRAGSPVEFPVASALIGGGYFGLLMTAGALIARSRRFIAARA